MANSNKLSPTQPQTEHRAEPATTDDGSLRGVGDEPTASQSDHSSKSGDHDHDGAEAKARKQGNEAHGGVSLNTSLEDGQLRGVDEDGQITQGTHGGPQKNKQEGEATAQRKR